MPNLSCRICVRSSRSRCSAAATSHGGVPLHGRRADSNSRSSSAPGPDAFRNTSPTGFSGVPPPGPAMPVTDTATSAPEPTPVRRAPSPPRSRPRRRRAPRARPRSPRAARASPRCRTPRRAPRKTSLEPGTDVSRAATSPPVHDSAAASDIPRSRRRSSTSSSIGRSSSREDRAAEQRSASSPPAPRPRRRARPGSPRVRADRRLHALRLSPGLGERPRDCRLADAVQAQHAPLRAPRRAPALRGHGSSSSAACQSLRNSGGGRAGRRQPRRSSRRRVPERYRRSRSRVHPRGTVACLRTPSLELPRAAALAVPRSASRHLVDLLFELRHH